jgi:hypothetical protein
MEMAPHLQLICIIDNLKHELDLYMQTPKPLQHIIDKRKDLIIQLTMLVDSIVKLDNDALSVDIYNEIKRLENADNTIDCFNILVIKKPNPTRPAVIKINYNMH